MLDSNKKFITEKLKKLSRDKVAVEKNPSDDETTRSNCDDVTVRTEFFLRSMIVYSSLAD